MVWNGLHLNNETLACGKQMWRKRARIAVIERMSEPAPLLLPDRGRGQEVQDGLLHAGVVQSAAAIAAANAAPLPLLVVLLHEPLGEQLPLNGLQLVLLQERDEPWLQHVRGSPISNSLNLSLHLDRTLTERDCDLREAGWL